MIPLDEKSNSSRPTPEPTPAAEAESRDSTEVVLRMLGNLPENQREVIRLKFQAQLTYEEIAGVTQLSASNVGFLLHTALRTLRQQMAALENIH